MLICILSLFLLMFSVGRLSMGILGDKIGATKVWAGANFLQAFCILGVALLFRDYEHIGGRNADQKDQDKIFGGVLVLCAVVGVCFSAVKVSVPGVLAGAWHGPQHVSPVMGLTGPAIAISVLIGALSIFYSQRGSTEVTSVNPFFYACCGMSLLSCIIVSFLPKVDPKLEGLQK